MAKLTEFIKLAFEDYRKYGKTKSPEEWMVDVLIREFKRTPEEAQNMSTEILEGIEAYRSKDKDEDASDKSNFEELGISPEDAQEKIAEAELTAKLMVEDVESAKNEIRG